MGKVYLEHPLHNHAPVNDRQNELKSDKFCHF